MILNVIPLFVCISVHLDHSFTEFSVLLMFCGPINIFPNFLFYPAWQITQSIAGWNMPDQVSLQGYWERQSQMQENSDFLLVSLVQAMDNTFFWQDWKEKKILIYEGNDKFKWLWDFHPHVLIFLVLLDLKCIFSFGILGNFSPLKISRIGTAINYHHVRQDLTLNLMFHSNTNLIEGDARKYWQIFEHATKE